MRTVERRITGGNPELKGKMLFTGAKKKIEYESPIAKEREHLPRLLGNKFEHVHFDPTTGSLFFGTFREKDSETLTKRWSKFRDLEDLTGAVAQVFIDHKPENGIVVQRTSELQRYITAKLERFGTTEVTDQQLEELGVETIDELKRLGFSNPVNPTKMYVKDRVSSAMKPDSLGRRNPLIARTRLAAALVRTYMLASMHDRIQRKYFELFSMLVEEHSVEQAITREVIEELEDSNSELPALFDAGGPKQRIKSAPWRVPVMRAYSAVTYNGHRTEQHRRYFADDPELWDQIQDRTIPLEAYRKTLVTGLRQSIADGISIYDPSV